MRKSIALLALVGVMCFNSISYAAIDRRGDSFDESVMIFSYSSVLPTNDLRFRKKIMADETFKYSILLSSNTDNRNNMYSEKNSQIKIDGKIYGMKILDVTYMQYDYSSDVIDSEAELLPEQIEKLKTAQKVSLRFYHENGLANTIDVPDYVLEEWKQVINAEE